MKSWYEQLYLSNPIFLQNIFISLYGIKLCSERYGRYYKAFNDEIEKRKKYSRLERDEYSISQLRDLVKHAMKHVSYYKEMYENCGINGDNVKTIQDIEKLPFLEKKIIRRDPEALIDNRRRTSDLICIHTTGSTGTPLKIFCDARVRQANYAFYDSFLRMNYINPDKKRATLGGRIIVPFKQTKPPFWRYSLFQKNLLLSSYHLKDNTISAYIEKLAQYKPHFIDSYPSSLYQIAKFAHIKNINIKNLTKGITTSAETLFPEQRNLIEKTFGVRIADQYGAAEMCVFIGQCPRGKYHINTDYGIVEIIRDDGTTAGLGEEGEIVCTGFINPVMPLIRYRIGDRGIMSGKSCDCGSDFPVLEKILGRIDDVIITFEGKKVGRLSPVLKGFPVKEAQYVQQKDGTVDIVIVKGAKYNQATEDSILMEMRKRIGKKTPTRFKYVDGITPGRGGKLRNIISYYKP